MSMNQIPMGTPAGNSDLIGRLASFMTGSGKKGNGSSRSGDIHRMAAQHALESVRSDRKHGQELERMNVGHANARELQSNDHAYNSSENALARQHEKGMQVRGIRADARTIAATHAHEQATQAAGNTHAQTMETLQSGNRVSEMRAAFRGIHSLGRAGHTASFNLGSMGATYHPPYQPLTHSETPNNSDTKSAPAAAAPAAPAAPTPPEPPEAPKNTKAPSIRDPKTGRAMRNPDYVSTKSETPKAPRPRTPKK